MNSKLNLPRHVAVIMDGNRRWARLNNLSNESGHSNGIDTLVNIAKIASEIAVFPPLREILNLKQLEFIDISNKQFGGCVIDGRDIGTKILPKANFKFFIDASIVVRAKRRMLEKNISFLHENDEKCMLQNLIDSMVERDNIDKSRKASPMVCADDAIIIDTTSINAEQLLLMATNIIEG